MKVQGINGMHTLVPMAFKTMSKEDFDRKYEGKLIDLDKVYVNLKAEIVKIELEEKTAKELAVKTAKEEAETAEKARKAIEAKKAKLAQAKKGPTSTK